MHDILYIINEIVKLEKKQAIKKKLEDMKSTKNNRKKKQMSKLGIDNNIVDPAKVVRMCCSVLQCVAVRCIVLQCVAVRCSALQCVAVIRKGSKCSKNWVSMTIAWTPHKWCTCVAVRCSALQCVAVRYSNREMNQMSQKTGNR